MKLFLTQCFASKNCQQVFGCVFLHHPELVDLLSYVQHTMFYSQYHHNAPLNFHKTITYVYGMDTWSNYTFKQ